MKQLLIAPGLSLPLDTVTSTLIAYGGKGMGKTNLGSVLVEELTRCGLRWAWLDPLGVSWGLRHSADGAGPGVECLILGGLHGDVPIEPAGGAAVADVVVEESTNVLIDFSRKTSGEMWTIGEKIRFVTAYALRLFQRQGEIVSGRRRDPLFQVLDEAARYIPQVIPSGAKELAESVGAWNQLVEEGRNVGVGVGLLTQRSARMAKSVSELADAMFAFRTVGPNSLTAILDWLGEHIEKERIKDLAATVRSLERGHALVVSPGWLKFEGVVKVRMRETFDSSATVKHGERQKTARGEGAKPDLAKIRARMATTIERAKAEDPRELRKTIGELRLELKRKDAVLAEVDVRTKRIDEKLARVKPARVVEKSILKDRDTRRLDSNVTTLNAISARLTEVAQKAQAAAEAVGAQVGEIKAALAAAREAPSGQAHVRATAGSSAPAAIAGRGGSAGALRAPGPSRPAPVVHHAARPPRSDDEGGGIQPAKQRILDALAYLESIGLRDGDRAQVALLADQSPTSGNFANYLGSLRTAALIDYPGAGRIRLTEAGRAVARAGEAPSTSEDLHETLRRKIPPAKWSIVEALIRRYPQSLSREQLAEAAHQSPTSGNFANYLGSLRSLGLIDYPSPGQVIARPVLFLEGA